MDDKEHKKLIEDSKIRQQKLDQENAEMRKQLDQAKAMKAQQLANKSKEQKGGWSR